MVIVGFVIVARGARIGIDQCCRSATGSDNSPMDFRKRQEAVAVAAYSTKALAATVDPRDLLDRYCREAVCGARSRNRIPRRGCAQQTTRVSSGCVASMSILLAIVLSL